MNNCQKCNSSRFIEIKDRRLDHENIYVNECCEYDNLGVYIDHLNLSEKDLTGLKGLNLPQFGYKHLNIKICLDCGTVDGKWPVTDSDVTDYFKRRYQYTYTPKKKDHSKIFKDPIPIRWMDGRLDISLYTALSDEVSQWLEENGIWHDIGSESIVFYDKDEFAAFKLRWL